MLRQIINIPGQHRRGCYTTQSLVFCSETCAAKPTSILFGLAKPYLSVLQFHLLQRVSGLNPQISQAFNTCLIQPMSKVSVIFLKSSIIYCKKKKIHFLLHYAVYLPETTFPSLPSLFPHLIQQSPLKDLFHNIKTPLYHQLLFRTFLSPLPPMDPDS